MRTEINLLLLKMSELEKVDSFNAIERHLLGEIQLLQFGKGNADTALVCKKMRGDLQTVFNVLPNDMQQLLLVNPQTASLLQGSVEVTKLQVGPSIDVDVASKTEAPTPHQ